MNKLPKAGVILCVQAKFDTLKPVVHPLSMWQDIVAAILTSGTITGIFVAIIKNGIAYRFDKELEAYKNKLKYESDIAVKDLELKAVERNIRLSHVFETTEKTIAEVYAKLLLVNNAADEYASLARDSTAREKSESIHFFQEKFREFYEFYHPKKIYIPKETRDKISVFLKANDKMTSKTYLSNFINSSSNWEGGGVQKLQDLIIKNDTELLKLYGEIPKLLESLEDDFQRILGFPIQSGPEK